jgi:hypothetical protein
MTSKLWKLNMKTSRRTCFSKATHRTWITREPVKDEHSDIAIAVMRESLCSGNCWCCHGDVLSFELIVGVIVREGLFPPFGRHFRIFPVWKRVNAVHGADRKALIAPAAQFRNDDHIGAHIEDGP